MRPPAQRRHPRRAGRQAGIRCGASFTMKARKAFSGLGKGDGPDRLDLGSLLRVYRTFRRHYQPYTRVLTVSFVCLFATLAAEMLTPWPLKLILDHVILKRPFTGRLAGLNGWLQNDPLSLLLVFALAIVVITFAEALFSYINKYYASGTGDRMAADIRERVFKHLQKQSLSLDESAHSGNVVYLLTSDTKMMKNLLIDLPQDVLQRVGGMVLYAGLMLALDWRLGLVALSTTPLVWFLTSYFGTSTKGAVKERRESESEVSSVVADNVEAMALVQAYGREATEYQRFSERNTRSLEAQLRALRLQRTYGRLVQLLITLSTAGVLWFGARYALKGDILPGTLVVFVAYLRDIYGYFEKFSLLFLNLARSLVSGERLAAFVEQEVKVEELPDAVPAPRFQGRIEFRDVNFAYRDGDDVLRGVSFVAEPGQRIAVVGPSGAGKSTLIGMLLRFYDPQRGQVLIDDRDVRAFTLKSLRDQITIVLQEAMLFQRSVAENIGFGKRGATREEIVAAAKRAEADGFISEMRDGYDTEMAEGGDNLSGGQRQRINIARAIIRDTPIVVLDEPLTGLDPRAEAEIGEAIRHLGEGRTTFIVAHRFSTVRDADAILVLDEGTLVGVGTHDQLLATCPRYRELWAYQNPAPAPGAFAGGLDLSPQPGGAA